MYDLLVVGGNYLTLSVAGAFGLSSAMAAIKRGMKKILILDQGSKGATDDINKVIRCDYGSDRFYSELALKAIEIWETWSNDSLKLLNTQLFHRTGVLILDKELDLTGFQRDSFHQLKNYGIIKDISESPPGMDKLRNDFPGGYINKIGGWGNSSQALVYCRHVLESEGVHFAIGKCTSFITNGTQIKGIICENGQEFYGKQVIMACGAWTPSIIKEMEGLLAATGQIVCHIHVPESLMSKYSWPNFQVWFADITRTGFYGFPVTKEGIMKISIHGSGYLTPNDSLISVPRYDTMIPSAYIAKFKEFIASYFPDLVDVELKFRWCYYTDSRDGDFYICRSPNLDGLYYATGGTGHAFKFMPVIGDIMLDVIQGVKSDLTERFKWRVPDLQSQKKLDGMRMIDQPLLHSSCSGELCEQNSLLSEVNYLQPSVYDQLRLPSWIVPVHYDLTINTQLDVFAYDGSVNIILNLTRSTNLIVFHAVDFRDLNVSIKGRSYLPIFNKKREYWVVYLESELESGMAMLSIDFKAALSKSLRGYYGAQVHTGNSSYYIATTQFEPTDARRAFPCFDEPAMKATFNITMIVQKGYHALSNMPILSTEMLQNGIIKTVFYKTKKMATYLIAFIVSDFEAVRGETARGNQTHLNVGTKVAVWTQPGKLHQAEYGVKVGISVLEYYEKLFGVNYPLPKSDMIAIPDFAEGAMENWGLITYRDTALLYDPGKSSSKDKQRVAEVIAHELAHQWFGNLVTMKWWSDLWLNEGFAEFMEYKGTNAAEPEWFMYEQFVFTELVRAMHADQSRFTHPVALNVSDPVEIREIFDDISYGKGASILRMLEAWVNTFGDENHFFSSLGRYLESHAYSNAQTADLWKALSTPNVSVGRVMSTWTDQPGYPIIKIDGNRISQERFYFSSESHQKELHKYEKAGNYSFDVESKNQVWIIPFLYSECSISEDDIVKSDLKVKMLETNGPVDVPIADQKFILGNFGRSGVYRVQYSMDTYRILSDTLFRNFRALSPNDRVGLLNDVFALSWSGRIKDVSVLLNMTRFLVNESDSVVWFTALAEMNSLESILALSASYGHFIEYYSKLLKNLYINLDWVERSSNGKLFHVRSLVRSKVLSLSIAFHNDESVNFALRKFQNLKSGEDDPDVTIDNIGVIYEAAALWGTEDDFDWLMDRYSESTFAPEKNRLAASLACTIRPHLQIRTLDLALSGKVRKQDILGLITAVASYSPLGHLYTWNWLRSNWNALIKIWGDDDFTRFNDMLERLVSKFIQTILIKEAEELFIDKTDPGFFLPPRSELSVSKGLEVAKQRTAWLKLNEKKIEKWLATELNKN